MKMKAYQADISQCSNSYSTARKAWQSAENEKKAKAVWQPSLSAAESASLALPRSKAAALQRFKESAGLKAAAQLKERKRRPAILMSA